MEKWWERHRVVLFIIVVVAAVVGAVLFQVLRPKAPPIILSTSTPSPPPEATPTPSPVRVYVSGAVHSPDVYTLAADSIVKDALQAAGGPTDDADLDRINLALPVADGQHVYIPHLDEENPPVRLPSNLPAVGGKVNVNTAEAAELESLPGIGPVSAQRILDYRQAHGPFTQIEDIMDVSGIGPATFEGMRDLITTD